MTEPAVWFVCVLGIAVVFIGLLFLIGIIMLMSFITDLLSGKNKKNDAVISNVKTVTDNNQVTENRQEMLAAVCAAVAEENGTDISAIRVISFKKL